MDYTACCVTDVCNFCIVRHHLRASCHPTISSTNYIKFRYFIFKNPRCLQLRYFVNVFECYWHLRTLYSDFSCRSRHIFINFPLLRNFKEVFRCKILIYRESSTTHVCEISYFWYLRPRTKMHSNFTKPTMTCQGSLPLLNNATK
jgi:hypothetical protein